MEGHIIKAFPSPPLRKIDLRTFVKGKQLLEGEERDKRNNDTIKEFL